MSRCKPHFPKRQAVCYIFRNQVATARGSNRRHVSIQSEGMLQLLPSCELLLANAGYLQRSYANTIASCHAEADGGFMADARQTNGSVRTWKPFDLAQRQRLICTLQNNSQFIVHIFLNQFAIAFGSNRTHVPTLNDGILPAFACLKIVIFETPSNLASSSAVMAPSMRSMCSARNAS